MILIAENDFGKVEYDSELKHIVYTFSGRMKIELAKELCLKIIEYAKDHEILVSMVNLSAVTGTFTGLQEFLIQNYFPVMIKRGLRGHGIVLSHDIFTKFAAESLVKKMGNFTIHTFNNYDECREWMTSLSSLQAVG